MNGMDLKEAGFSQRKQRRRELSQRIKIAAFDE